MLQNIVLLEHVFKMVSDSSETFDKYKSSWKSGKFGAGSRASCLNNRPHNIHVNEDKSNEVGLIAVTCKDHSGSIIVYHVQQRS